MRVVLSPVSLSSPGREGDAASLSLLPDFLSTHCRVLAHHLLVWRLAPPSCPPDPELVRCLLVLLKEVGGFQGSALLPLLESF